MGFHKLYFVRKLMQKVLEFAKFVNKFRKISQ